MREVTNLRGRRFGRLRVPTDAEYEIRDYVPGKGGKAYWPTVCDCGNEQTVRGTKLTREETVSCGCQKADPEVRREARLQTPARRRKAISREGAAARWAQ
jgi:hypothetical protein